MLQQAWNVLLLLNYYFYLCQEIILKGWILLTVVFKEKIAQKNISKLIISFDKRIQIKLSAKVKICGKS